MYDIVETTLKELLDAAGFSYKGIVRQEVAGQVVFSIEADDARTLIGMHGDTVHALDTLVKKIVEKHIPAPAQQEGAPEEGGEGKSEGLHFLVDVNDYRSKQIKDLQSKALMMAERARSFQYDVELSPMTAYERLIVHTALQNEPNVKTESQGEGRNRRVVIKYSAG
jgi:spoIIIJ-associated protein